MSRRIALRRLLNSPSRFVSNRSVAVFSTSACTNIRQRPGRRGVVRKAMDGAGFGGQDEGMEPMVPLPLRFEELKLTTQSPLVADREGNSVSEGNIATEKQVRPRKPTRRGMKSHQQSLYELESICYRQDEITPAQISKPDKPPLAAAAKFFEHGCRLLYSADSLYNHIRNDHVPEIVVLGASNAGKSSFLNALVGRSDIARVSSRPGRTTTMNAYGVGHRPKISRDLIQKGDPPPKHSLILVDTPGYGFKSRSDWGDTILKYLDVRKMLRGAVLLIPANKKLQDMDKWMLKTLARTNTRTLVVLTKADKNGDVWGDSCSKLATTVRREIQSIATRAARSWAEEYGHSAQIYATAANMGISTKLGNGAGLGGVRLAVLEMAGFSLQSRVEQRPETKTYAGPVVSFDDIQWKA